MVYRVIIILFLIFETFWEEFWISVGSFQVSTDTFYHRTLIKNLILIWILNKIFVFDQWLDRRPRELKIDGRVFFHKIEFWSRTFVWIPEVVEFTHRPFFWALNIFGRIWATSVRRILRVLHFRIEHICPLVRIELLNNLKLLWALRALLTILIRPLIGHYWLLKKLASNFDVLHNRDDWGVKRFLIWWQIVFF